MDRVTYIPGDLTAPVFERGGDLARGAGYVVSVARRTAGGEVEIHDHETDTFHVLEGSATIVTGGTVVGRHTVAPGQHRGSAIEGGETCQLRPGDVIIIPEGTPHWFKDVAGTIRYYVVKAVSAPATAPDPDSGPR